MIHPRHLAPLLPLGLALGCAVAVAPPSHPAPSAVPSVLASAQDAPVSPEPVETDPYRPPAFDPPPAPTEAGAWVPQLTMPPPTPEPSPTPTPLQQATFLPILITAPDGAVAPVGGSLRLIYEPAFGTSVPTGLPWRLLDTSAGTVEDGQRIRVARPGPIYAYVEHAGGRHYVLLAGTPAQPVARRLPLEGMHIPYDSRVPWATYFRNIADWRAFWDVTSVPGPPEPAVDFNQEEILAVRGSGGYYGLPAAFTGFGPDGAAEVVVPELPDFRPAPAVVVGTLDLFALPKSAVARQLRVHGGGWAVPFLVTGPTGPTPTPEPTPVAWPSGPPGDGFPPCARGDRPPYGPPNLGAFKSCFPPGPSLFINFLTYPVNAPWAPVVRPGEGIALAAPSASGPVTWRVADPRLADIDAAGRLVAKRPGAIAFTASAATTSGAATAHGLLACTAAEPPALNFQYRCDWDAPADATPRGPRIYRADDAAWRARWREGFLNAPPAAPAVDFSRFDVVALVADRFSEGDSTPVLTHVSGNRGVVHLAYPGAQSFGGVGYGKHVHLFLTGKLAPAAEVVVTTLCGEERVGPL